MSGSSCTASQSLSLNRIIRDYGTQSPRGQRSTLRDSQAGLFPKRATSQRLVHKAPLLHWRLLPEPWSACWLWESGTCVLSTSPAPGTPASFHTADRTEEWETGKKLMLEKCGLYGIRGNITTCLLKPERLALIKMAMLFKFPISLESNSKRIDSLMKSSVSLPFKIKTYSVWTSWFIRNFPVSSPPKVT